MKHKTFQDRDTPCIIGVFLCHVCYISFLSIICALYLQIYLNACQSGILTSIYSEHLFFYYIRNLTLFQVHIYKIKIVKSDIAEQLFGYEQIAIVDDFIRLI